MAEELFDSRVRFNTNAFGFGGDPVLGEPLEETHDYPCGGFLDIGFYRHVSSGCCMISDTWPERLLRVMAL